MSNGNTGWIGVDLDGTLAEYTGWVDAAHIGAPVPAMLARVKAWRAAGREVRVFTARVWPHTRVFKSGQPYQLDTASEHMNDRELEALRAVRAIAEWCTQHVGEVLPITCVKDYGMIELWDDRAVQVTPNTGAQVGAPPEHLLEDAERLRLLLGALLELHHNNAVTLHTAQLNLTAVAQGLRTLRYTLGDADADGHALLSLTVGPNEDHLQ